jgi:hypothetical protein
MAKFWCCFKLVVVKLSGYIKPTVARLSCSILLKICMTIITLGGLMSVTHTHGDMLSICISLA